VGAGTADGVWVRLDVLHGEPGRAYHNWSHIAAMLADLAALRDHAAFTSVDFDELELAIFFHDAVYRPGQADNEAQSAALFREAAGGQPAMGPASLHRVVEMILATARHLPSDDLATQLLLDLDLAVLGGSPQDYARYVAAVRTEFSVVSDAAWRQGRAAVMRRFLDRPALYQTAVFRRLEAQARANIAGEIEALESGRH